MAKRGIEPDSPEAKLFARKLLTALTKTFGRNILETGFFHAGTIRFASMRNQLLRWKASFAHTISFCHWKIHTLAIFLC